MRLALAAPLAALACATAAPPRPRAARAPPPPVVAPATPPTTASAPPEPIAVRGTAPEPLEFVVTGRSDLPAGASSTARPYEQIVDESLAPVRPALAECLRALGAPARRVVRVTLEDDGTVRERPPQAYVLSARDAACVVNVLRGTVLDPAPPRAIPYDIRVDVER
ncbi:MAG: hypothetical protein U0324_09850 [Polyangiales bacterium]